MCDISCREEVFFEHLSVNSLVIFRTKEIPVILINSHSHVRCSVSTDIFDRFIDPLVITVRKSDAFGFALLKHYKDLHKRILGTLEEIITISVIFLAGILGSQVDRINGRKRIISHIRIIGHITEGVEEIVI